ncbi:hypothetical protein KCU66_g20170, partial [Aureobasidium melanogenum]
MSEQEGVVMSEQGGALHEEAAPQQQDAPQEQLPIDWPEDIEYLRRPKISPAVPA